MKIRIVSIGKTKKGYIDQGIQDYLERLRHYTSIDWVVIRPSGKSNALLRRDRLRDEAERIRDRLNPDALIVVLTEKGKELSTPDFAAWIERLMVEGRNEVDFVIGGDSGIDPGVISGADLSISLSRMTFTHQIVRLILLEQIYRAFTIIRGEPYHHE
ncbi:23S rRNA (pseudouridine(1915)-N(3))-methyltransferase RlmH [bacterium]|nr:23S rRNA (pseudouridine(1915)-N(3))-methyltransferase RlmH [bacterium]